MIMTEINKIYVVLPNESEWEDLRLFINEEDANMELAKFTSNNWRIEIFCNENGKFVPSYNEPIRSIKQ